jgi:hypothetical protein
LSWDIVMRRTHVFPHAKETASDSHTKRHGWELPKFLTFSSCQNVTAAKTTFGGTLYNLLIVTCICCGQLKCPLAVLQILHNHSVLIHSSVAKLP